MKTHLIPLTMPALCVLALSITTQSGVAADTDAWSVGVGFDYSSGTYGESQSTDILYIPVIGKYEIESWVFKLTVPYISVRGPGNVIPGVGEVNRTPSTVTTQTGLGDIVAAATYTLYAGDASSPGWDLTGKIKFGTADADKGLGTGENDYSAQVDVYQAFGRTTAFGTLGYSILGSSATIQLKNVFYAAVGASYKFSDELSSGLSLYFRQAASSTSGQQSDLTAFATYNLDPVWRLQGYALLGFASGSPDWAIGAVVSRSF